MIRHLGDDEPFESVPNLGIAFGQGPMPEANVRPAVADPMPFRVILQHGDLEVVVTDGQVDVYRVRPDFAHILTTPFRWGDYDLMDRLHMTAIQILEGVRPQAPPANLSDPIDKR